MTTLARKLRGIDYFTLGWGTMVGVGWLVVMDDWLLRGGVLGAILGFALGGTLLFPVAYVYGQLVRVIPDAAGEVAYTAKVFPQYVSFATGWMMVLSYLIVCPWEAVAVGKIASYIFPALDSVELYRIAGRPVYLPHLLIGLGLVVLLTLLNYRGIRSSASFQNWTAFGTLALFVAFVGVGVRKGSVSNFPPLFTHGRFVSILLVMQIVPYFMTGYESSVKGAEEASPDFDVRGFSKAMATAIAVGILFYTIIIAAVGYVAPWRQLTDQKFMTAVAFERAVGSRAIVGAILTAALLSLVKCFNGNFVAASRLLFAMARRGLVANNLARIHSRNHTPYQAVIWVGITTAVCMFLGDAILVPVTEVGSVASATGWLAACAAYHQMRPSPGRRTVAIVGAVLGSMMVLMKILPFVPGHFSRYEWLALGLWVLLGIALKRWRRTARVPSGEVIR